MDDRVTNYTGWQSDVIVDLIKRYEFPYITLNPGASFRGLHDSLINYGDNQPPMMLCNHEEIAVQIAHGYTKATGKPMAVILHNLVGLLHACMAIYYAYLDRVPIFIIGATGPMDEAKRRPHIDWTHTALVQGNAVRDYVKWDYQPTSIDGVPESFARAYSVMMTEPKGPVYMCYDAALQEAPKTHDVPLPPVHAVAAPSPMAPDPRAIEAIADKLLKADHPMLLPEYAGRRAGGFESIIELAELTGSAVWDVNNALNFPNKHPLCLSMDKPSLKTTDLIVGLDVKDWEKQLTELNNAKRIREFLPPASCDFVEIGFAEVGISKWAMDYCRMQPCSVRALGDTTLGIPALIEACRQRIGSNANLQKKIADRKIAIG
ncbi:MAG TPA: thiamine pyrophosphate-binding protein, partial [Bradyrhizobium sp.]|nr:thiamine pyrophosphate-binding protein [Bradyrhizobium sp.]